MAATNPKQTHFIYCFIIPSRKEFKIGIAVNIAQREAQLFRHKRRSSAAQGVVGTSDYVLAWFIAVEDRETAFVYETNLHQRLSEWSKTGEVFHLTPQSWKILLDIAEEYII